MTQDRHLALFEGFGVEIEYMIVQQESLQVAPVADQLLMNEHGSFEDLVRGPIGWSNELVNHVIELKTAGPAARLAGLGEAFHREVVHINRSLANLGACLLPTGMHPTMHPATETVLWPHDSKDIYQAFDRIFGCSGHGWSNLQSVHLNLPFKGDAEFGRLHAAIRLLLPILPALSASSPLVEGRTTGCINNRLTYYRDNAIRIPSVAGGIVPEAVFTRKDYETIVLARIYQDLAPHDPEGLLQHEWANARGAIARFDRQAIEIRLLDVQECPAMDMAIVALVVAVLQAACQGRWQNEAAQRAHRGPPLVALMRKSIAYAHQAVIDDPDYLRAWGYTAAPRADAQTLWRHLIDEVFPAADHSPWRRALAPIVEHGPLGQRITQALGKRASKDGIAAVYRRLAGCLADNEPFLPHPAG